MAIKEIHNKFSGYTPKKDEVTQGWEKGPKTSGNRLDKVNPYEFRKGMDYELTAIGVSRLQESTPEEREKATESVLKNLDEHDGYYTALITYETEYRGRDNKPSFKSWLSEQDEFKMKEINQTFKNDKMTEYKKDSKEEYTKKFETSPSPLKESKIDSLKKAIKKEM